MTYGQIRIPSWLLRLRTTAAVRFTRFAGVALAALATSELVLMVCDGVFHLTAGKAAVASWFAGAVVSYVLSRWAWERKGRPDLLRETLPFWLISAAVVVILTLSTKAAYAGARAMGLHGAGHALFVGVVYLAANCVTFVIRFLIFHYVLFKDSPRAALVAKPRQPRPGPGEDAPGEEALDEQAEGAAPAQARRR